jgi:glutamate mutase epsilon subunit
MKYEISEFKLASDNSITLTNTLENDIRHDGKTFMLAVQIKQGSTIVDNIIPKMITLTANGKTSDPIYPIIDSYGRVTAYFNLSELLEEGKTTVDFNINVSSGYTVSSVALLEAENALKPAMAEVRYIYTN